jgi:TPR repeat protein
VLDENQKKKYSQIMIEDLREASNSDVNVARLSFAKMLHDRAERGKDEKVSAHDLKLTADQGLSQAQLDYANCLVCGDGVKRDVSKAEEYFQLASHGDSTARLRYGIALLS